jgi:hypothetical protein
MIRNKYAVPEALKAEYVATAGKFNWALKDLLHITSNSSPALLMGNNRTLSIIPRNDDRPVVLVCEFNAPPEEPNYARFKPSQRFTSLDIVNEQFEYECPHTLGVATVEMHIKLAREATKFLTK